MKHGEDRIDAIAHDIGQVPACPAFAQHALRNQRALPGNGDDPDLRIGPLELTRIYNRAPSADVNMNLAFLLGFLNGLLPFHPPSGLGLCESEGAQIESKKAKVTKY